MSNMVTKDGCFWVKEAGGNQYNMGFTKSGLKSFGALFVCEPLVKSGAKLSSKTKLFAIEGMCKLTCLKSVFSEGEVKSVNNFINDPSEINPETHLITISGTLNALSLV